MDKRPNQALGSQLPHEMKLARFGIGASFGLLTMSVVAPKSVVKEMSLIEKTRGNVSVAGSSSGGHRGFPASSIFYHNSARFEADFRRFPGLFERRARRWKLRPWRQSRSGQPGATGVEPRPFLSCRRTKGRVLVAIYMTPPHAICDLQLPRPAAEHRAFGDRRLSAEAQ